MTGTNTSLPDEQFAELHAIAERAVALPLFVSDCEGKLQVWAERALEHVQRDTNGQIAGYCLPSSYRSPDQVIEIDLDSWDLGEVEDDDQRRQDIGDLVDARAALPAVLADNDRLRREAELVTEYGVPLEGRGWLLVRRSATTGLWAVTTGGLRGRKVWTPDGWRPGALLADAEIYRWQREEALEAATQQAFLLGGES